MIKVTAKQLYDKLVNECELVGKKGAILFTLNDFPVQVTTKDTVGNMIQEWLKGWMEKEKLSFEVNPSSQTFPDIFLNLTNKKKGLLEIKAFDFKRGAGFDLANFESYCNSLLEHSYRLDSDYLILGYTMKGSEITIHDIWLKKIWEIAGPSGPYPIKVQEKKKVIYNLRLINWYSGGTTFKPFETKEAFLTALNNTRYQYFKTRSDNSHWLATVIDNYRIHTGTKLIVDPR